jgi:nicotinamidase-related amidase
MTESVWDQFFTERDRQVIAASGYRAKQGYGKRPAVLAIDFTYFFCGERREPILESIKRWGNSCGAHAWNAIEETQRLLAAARAKDLPVIYTKGTRRSDGWDSGSWRWKYARTGEQPSVRASNPIGDQIVAELSPGPRDIVIEKLKPSAFHGTPILDFLTLLGADSLIVAGGTTSGCVRASVVDAFSHNYRVALVETACFDRLEVSHAVSLGDMDAKYADVVSLTDALTFIEGLPDNLFDLPKGEAPGKAG